MTKNPGGNLTMRGATRRWRLAALVVLAAAAYTAYTFEQKPAGRPGFADLDRALEPMLKTGWVVAVPPKRPGPYRLVPGDPTAPPGVAGRVRDRDGTTEELTLAEESGFDQAVVTLETADGHQTLAGLKRPRGDSGAGRKSQ